MTRTRPLVFIVDDDENVCTSLVSVLKTYGNDAACFAGVDAMLRALDGRRPDCILMDVRMPGIDGLEAQRLLAGRAESPPVILMTGHGDIAMAVGALKNGAHDFIEKPVDDERLAKSISEAIARHGRKSGTAARFSTLSPRERSIAALVAKGYSTYAIAGELGISNRTVDHHRASILAKMQATSLPQLMSMLLELNTHDPSG